MSFVKANVIYDCLESITYDDQNSSQSSHEGKDGIDHQRPENFKPSWLKNRLDKDKAKAGSKSHVQNRPRRNFRKAKSGWKKTQPRRYPIGQHVKSKLKRSHGNFSQTFVDPKTGKTVKEIQVWVPKGQVVSAWNRSSRSLHKLHESQKLTNDKSGLGFNSSECSEGETCTQSQSAYDKFNKMSFVKANVIYDCLESITYDDQNSPKLNDNGKAGIGFSKPESSKPSWLKNKLDKGKAKAGQKPFVPNQPRRSSKKVKNWLEKYSAKERFIWSKCEIKNQQISP
ncbi:hypothetical protein F511_37790 [Dorcoceras hygrometricum]|uniref:Uncharacterized protein n=1 Tax=Dorcoceras hygrometricum TaxID=472368 RepID=A0A2Z7APQ9_9LAMI|nr:hypothetical protein F511_37790 [Dorcoceras hygrometricum]